MGRRFESFPATQEPRHLVETSAKIAILIEQIEKVQRDNSVALVTKVGPDLLEQILAQGAQPGRGLVEPGTSLRIEASVATVPWLRLAAKIDSRSPSSPHSGCQCSAASGVNSPVSISGTVIGGALSPPTTSSPGAFPDPPLTPFQQRVLLDLDIDEIGQLEVRELQHFDRLLQLWSHDQRLRLTQLKPRQKT